MNTGRSLRQLQLIVLVCLVQALFVAAQPEDNTVDIVHVVRAGENLTSIAAAYGVTVDEITTTNDLDPEALLQVGQRLFIAFSLVDPEAESPTAVPAARQDVDAQDPEEPRAIGGKALENDLPPAPVSLADAPMIDPGKTEPILCLALFRDDNENGALDLSEPYLPGGQISLVDIAGNQPADHGSDGVSAPFCIDDLRPQVYVMEVQAPAGFALTSTHMLRVDLSAGGTLTVNVGARQGLPLDEQPWVASGGSDAAIDVSAAERSPLLELSGLFVIGLSGIVLICGLVVSLFLRLQ